MSDMTVEEVRELIGEFGLVEHEAALTGQLNPVIHGISEHML